MARLQKSTLQEVARTHDELAAIGLKNQYLVINGVLPETEAVNDTLAAAIWGQEQEALASLPAGLDALPTDTLFLQPVNMVGVSLLYGDFSPPNLRRLHLLEVSALQNQTISSLSALVDDCP